MPSFSYRVIDSAGRSQTAQLQADDAQAALRWLHEQGFRVISLEAVSLSRKGAGPRASRGARGRLDDLAAISEQLAIMVRAGVPLTEALSSLRDQARSRVLRTVLGEVVQALMQGYSLSHAASRYPRVFPRLFVDMVRTGEVGGDLSQVLERLAGYLDNSLDTARKVKSALIYPAIIVAISIVTVILLTTFVLPRFTQLFHDMHVAIPPTTRVLMTLSHLTTCYWYLALGMVAAVMVFLKLFASSATGRYSIDWLLLHLPAIGDIVRKIVLARSTMALGTLLDGGVPLAEALDTSAEVSGNELYMVALTQLKQRVQSGVTIADSARETGMFPPLVLQMVSAGERTGELPEMLLRLSAYYTRETETKVRGLTSIIEPALIVFLGGFVGFIAVSIISPIYSVVGGVK